MTRHLTTTRLSVLFAVLVFVGAVSVLAVAPVAAHGGSDSGGHQDGQNSTDTCNFEHSEWRNAMTIAGVQIQEDQHCQPDNPYTVAAATKGTNNVPKMVRMKSGLSKDAIKKSNDRDGDGDPDVIEITMEVSALNTKGGSVSDAIAPGVKPTIWMFSPKTNGMVKDGAKADQIIRPPTPPLRVEKGDTVKLTVENTHWFPHTVHLHGVDHTFAHNGTPQDGVPQTGRSPIAPGESRTYTFTPEQTGTMFYHCHVIPDIHVTMGLQGMFIVTEDYENNNVQTVNIGAGKVRHPSKQVTESENYTAAYDLQYRTMPKELTDLPRKYDNPAKLATAVNRRYDATDSDSDYFLLNGNSFPYTLQSSTVIVEPNETYKLNVLNGGPGQISLHTHGHKFNITSLDGTKIPESQQRTRDVVAVSEAQRVTLELNTSLDGRPGAYSPGLWYMHDHREKAVTTNGVTPGGTVSMIVYERYLNDEGMPKAQGKLKPYFNKSYYDGEARSWGKNSFPVNQSGLSKSDLLMDAVGDSAHNEHMHGKFAGSMEMQMKMGKGMVVNPNTKDLPAGCDEISGTREITVKAGSGAAGEGEVYGYNFSEIHVDKCTKLTITVVNTDSVRHQFMIHGLPTEQYPMGMFNIETEPGATVTGTFIVPGKDATFTVHCSLPRHEDAGMHGKIVVGDGTPSSTDTNDDDRPLPPAYFLYGGGALLVLGIAGKLYLYVTRNPDKSLKPSAYR